MSVSGTMDVENIFDLEDAVKHQLVLVSCPNSIFLSCLRLNFRECQHDCLTPIFFLYCIYIFFWNHILNCSNLHVSIGVLWKNE